MTITVFTDFSNVCKDTTFMHIFLDISPIIFILAGISFFFSIIFIIWEYLDFRSLKKAVSNHHSYSPDISPKEESCGVSIVVYAGSNTAVLARNLPKILDQDYPLYEVIVVNDGKSESTSDFIERLSLQHKNLHYSFTPDDARNLSRKKLALMLGIKAAQYDIILTTNSNCTPQSRHWVSSIARHFSSGVDVVIGHSRLSENSDTGRGCRLRSFIYMKNTIKYLVQAIRRKPYRGTSDNLAYRKSLFLSHKGFSQSMHLHYGDDDLFVNEIAIHGNTHVELSPESIITVSHDNPAKALQTLKLHRTFSESKIRSSAFFLENLKTAIYILNIMLIAGIAVLGFNNPIIIAVLVFTAAIMFIPQIITYRKTAETLQLRKLLFSIPIFTLLTPAVEWHYKIKCRRHKSYFYTWQPLKS